MSGPFVSKAPRVWRTVKVGIPDVPIWGVDALFHRIHRELERPNVVGEISATLVIHYELDEDQYVGLQELSDRIWQSADVELLDERIKERVSEAAK